MAALSVGTLVVFGLIAVALVLFVTETVPPDITAIAVLVALAVLQPWTGVRATEAIQGFASTATVTIIAMYILSEGVQQTGVVERLGVVLARVTRGDERRLLTATVGTTGVAAGIINNTPVVAVFIPMITGLADRAGLSPSKLLLPLSYAAMMGGTLTLIGTSTNLLASDLSRELLGRPIGMFEFTPLGLLVLIVGGAYLLTVGRWLTPARLPPHQDFTDEFDLDRYLSRVRVGEGAAVVGQSIDAVETTLASDDDVDLLQLKRNGETYLAPSSDQTVAVGDVLIVRGTLQSITRLTEAPGLRLLHRDDVGEEELVEGPGTLVEAVVLPDSGLVDKTVAATGLEGALHTTVLAIRRGETVLRESLDDVVLDSGDTLLLQTTDEAVDYLVSDGDLLVTHRSADDPPSPEEPAEAVAPLSPKTPWALGILGSVIALAALGVVPIVIAALGGVVAMVVTGTVTTADAYEAVSWNVVFLLAGVLPLGVAMQRTGGDAVIASVLVGSADVLPVLGVLALFYVLTALLASIITPVASVVLMIPIAVDTAARIGADGFAFLLAVTFAASGAFMTPIGYQTNLMVYGPGNYRFSDYLRVGGPLQLLLAGVVTLGIAFFFGV
ncbi:SLC13 family permease [Halobaculum lipolyticum]|uniref:SLC13 family permease n=1 Tax=Halobaculum lipolyticum TaxID=3032001 RepID=A0ABD5WH99_9EURY|nr:SLC13 family permease [Halobaculum sp. DT31]